MKQIDFSIYSSTSHLGIHTGGGGGGTGISTKNSQNVLG